MVTSASNSTVKQIRALQHRKERERTGTFFVEGIRLVAEATQSGAEIELIVVAPELLRSTYAQRIVDEARAPILEVSRGVFESLSRKEGPQGLAAVVRQRWSPLTRFRGSEPATWVALDAVQDPGNVGTIVRTCDATGSAGLILIGPTVDPYDPAAVRASMGTIFTQRLARCSWDELLTWASSEQWKIVGASDKAEAEYRRVRYPRRLVLLMGSERKGLSSEQQSACDLTVRIPMAGKADSLNLAVATSVILYEVFEQRRQSG